MCQDDSNECFNIIEGDGATAVDIKLRIFCIGKESVYPSGYICDVYQSVSIDIADETRFT